MLRLMLGLCPIAVTLALVTWTSISAWQPTVRVSQGGWSTFEPVGCSRTSRLISKANGLPTCGRSSLQISAPPARSIFERLPCCRVLLTRTCISPLPEARQTMRAPRDGGIHDGPGSRRAGVREPGPSRRHQRRKDLGPRVVASGPWLGTSGATCDFNGIGVLGVDAFRARVREDARRGADLIKVCVTGWPAQGYAQPETLEITPGELEVVVQEAKAAGLRVAAHAIGAAGVKLAVTTGVDMIVHGGFADQETVALMKQREVFMTPTLASFAPQRNSPHGKALFERVKGPLLKVCRLPSARMPVSSPMARMPASSR